MVEKYIPSQKDIVYLDFYSQTGHEQTGRRPALVLSNKTFNKFTSLALVCPITSNTKEFPFHVLLSNNKTKGVVMCEQIKVVDFQARNITYKEKIQNDTYNEVIDIVKSFIDIETYEE